MPCYTQMARQTKVLGTGYIRSIQYLGAVTNIETRQNLLRYDSNYWVSARDTVGYPRKMWVAVTQRLYMLCKLRTKADAISVSIKLCFAQIGFQIRDAVDLGSFVCFFVPVTVP